MAIFGAGAGSAMSQESYDCTARLVAKLKGADKPFLELRLSSFDDLTQ
jgi:hypothetical protein